MRRTGRRIAISICLMLAGLTTTAIRAAQPVTIPFDDITNKPFGFDSLPPFTWRGVLFSGGGLHRTDILGTWYQARNRNAIEMVFPPGSTDISFDVDGRGQSLLLFEYMPIQVWEGSVGSGVVLQTLPIPASLAEMYPPKHKVTIPGPASQITIFTARPPSGISEFANVINLDNVRYTPPDPEPAITFDPLLPSQARVLTHNYGDDPYPSSLQTEDRTIRVEATVRLNGLPAAGKTIHFRVTDPPDTAAYVTNAGNSQPGDNFDGAGSLNGGGPTTTGVSDATGRVSVTLRITPFAAGDNYQIEASPNAAFSCGATCAKSAVYTAWKRLYLEVDRMFRRGAYITENIPANSRYVYVSDLSQFQSGDVVRLIHAPRLEPQPSSTTSSQIPQSSFFYSEDHVVDVVPVPTVLPDGTVQKPHLQLRAGDTLGAPFGVDMSFTTPGAGGTPIPYLRDAVGVVSAGFYEPDLALLGTTYATMYVEIVPAAHAVSEIPFEPQLAGALHLFLANKWFENGQKTTVPTYVIPDFNHVQISGGTRIADIFNPSTGTYGAQLGHTPPGNSHHRSWVWVRRIELAVAEPVQPVHLQSAQIVNRETTLHESMHQWEVNPPPNPPNVTAGHCLRERYQHDGVFCHMHAPFYDPQHNHEMADGVADFHYEVSATGTVDSEYLLVRRHNEPLVP